MVTHKWCPRCKTTKPASDFYTRTINGHPDLQGWCKDCMKKRIDQWVSVNPGRMRRLNRRATLRQYGLGLHDYDVLCQRQANCCAICGREAALVVDHDHATGKVRGLLCDGCNWVLGQMQDNPAWLRQAAAYLEQDVDLRAWRPLDLGGGADAG